MRYPASEKLEIIRLVEESALAKWLNRHDMGHVRGAPYHPMTQGKIERWHQTLKNRILLENYYLPGDLEAQIEAFCGRLQPPPLPREHS